MPPAAAYFLCSLWTARKINDYEAYMNTYVQIVGDSRAEVWGMTGRERLARMLDRIAGVEIITSGAELPPGAPGIYFRGDYIFDARVLQAVMGMDGEFVLYGQDGRTAVVIRTNDPDENIFNHDHYPEALKRIGLDDLVKPYNDQLKKYERAKVWRITPDNRDFLEQELFSRSYKGVTDLVTKWVWPLPARWATKICAGLGLKPNHVTVFSLVLAILAGIAFWYGEYTGGLLLGWFMTFLDTVDGKLARVTLTSSRFGDLLDHSLDLVHPPFWYIAWGMGLSAQTPAPVSLTMLLWLMFGAYVGGRLCEGVFQHYIADFSIFMWRPVDSMSRLITARRNPNMLILTAGVMAGRPDAGLVLIIAWHLLSTLFLIIRLAVAWQASRNQGPLESWLERVGPETRHNRVAVKIFT